MSIRPGGEVSPIGARIAMGQKKPVDKYMEMPAEKMTDKRLKRYLCGAGPVQCRTCKSCAYGREWVKREETSSGASAPLRWEGCSSGASAPLPGEGCSSGAADTMEQKAKAVNPEVYAVAVESYRLLDELRQKAGISWRDLERRTGISSATAYWWRVGRSAPNMLQFRRLLDALGVEMVIRRKGGKR